MISGDSSHNPFDDFNTTSGGNAASQDQNGSMSVPSQQFNSQVQSSLDSTHEDQMEFFLLEKAFNTILAFEKLGNVLLVITVLFLNTYFTYIY